MGDTEEGSSQESNLEGIILHYANLPELRDRLDISRLVGDTVERKDKLDAVLKKTARSVCDVPLLAGAVPTIAFLSALGYDRATGTIPGYTTEHGAAIVFSSYAAGVIGMSILKQYGLKRRIKLKPNGGRRAGLFEKMRCGLLNNPHLGGAVSMVALPGMLHFIEQMNSSYSYYAPDGSVAQYGWALLLLGYGLGYGLVDMAKSNELLKRGFEKRDRKSRVIGNKNGLVEQIYNYPLEHPGIAAGIAGAIPSAYIAYMSAVNGKNPFEVLTPDLYAGALLYSGLFAALAYIGMSAASWLLHSNNWRVMSNSIMQRVNSWRGRTDEAIANQLWLMSVPTTASNERKNHFRLGDLYLRKENLEEALSEYYKALMLLREGEQSYSNQIDAIMGALDSVNILKIFGDAGDLRDRGLVDKDEAIENQYACSAYFPNEYEKNFTPEIRERYSKWEAGIDRSNSERLKRFVREVKNRGFNDADRTLRLIVRSEPFNPEYHLLYAGFLDVVGDRDMASDEYLIATRILVENPKIAGNFERIGVSRNEVLTYKASEFLNKTLIFKRSRNKEEIEQEYANLSYFYGRLGEKVAKPLTMLEEGEWHYLIMEHSGEMTLHELAEKGQLDYETLEETIGLLCEIQEAGEEYGTRA